jgi:hypothetical protein
MQDKKQDALEYPGLNAGTGTYSITAPEGWEKQDTTISGTKLTSITSPLENPFDDFSENVNVVTEDTKSLDLEAYTNANKSNLKTQLQESEIIDMFKTMIDGYPANAIVYSFKYGKYDLKNTAYLLTSNGIGYVITCSAIKNKFDKFQPEFQTCVNSFSINK